MPYAVQLATKGRRVEEALRRYPSLADTPLAPALAASPILGYRRRVKWMVGPNGELGLYRKDRAHEVVDVPRCRVVSAPISTVGASLRRLLARRSPEGLERLRAVDLRELRDDAPRVSVTLVFARGTTPDARALASIASAIGDEAPVVASVFLNEVEPGAIQVLGPTTSRLLGPAEGWDRIAGARVLAAPGSFVQAHDGQAEAIADALRSRARTHRDSLGRAPKVLDLFSGSGTWALAVASEGAEVVAIESYAPAAERIVSAARAASVSVTARAQDAQRAAIELASEGARFDLVIVNPPRRGLTPALRSAIARLEPREVAYVSCDPDTLARDLSDFVRLGLAARSVRPIDMIPLTVHVEALALLEPSAVPPPTVISALGALVLLDKPPHATIDALARVLEGDGGARVRRGAGPSASCSGVAALDRGAHGEPPLDLAAARADVVAAVKGVTHKRGTLRDRRGRTFRYARAAVASGHSLLHIECALGDAAHLAPTLASIGHPPLGADEADARTKRHFADRYGLDRPFVHVVRVALGGVVAEAAPAPDLVRVGEAMGFPRWTSPGRSG